MSQKQTAAMRPKNVLRGGIRKQIQKVHKGVATVTESDSRHICYTLLKDICSYSVFKMRKTQESPEEVQVFGFNVLHYCILYCLLERYLCQKYMKYTVPYISIHLH